MKMAGLVKTRFNPQFDYLESKPYDYLKTKSMVCVFRPEKISVLASR